MAKIIDIEIQIKCSIVCNIVVATVAVVVGVLFVFVVVHAFNVAVVMSASWRVHSPMKSEYSH